MAKRRYSPERITGRLRAIEPNIARGDTVAESCRRAGVNVQTYCRRRTYYEG